MRGPLSIKLKSKEFVYKIKRVYPFGSTQFVISKFFYIFSIWYIINIDRSKIDFYFGLILWMFLNFNCLSPLIVEKKYKLMCHQLYLKKKKQINSYLFIYYHVIERKVSSITSINYYISLWGFCNKIYSISWSKPTLLTVNKKNRKM